ncbi:MAG: hypothetical protein ACRET0_00560 [Steroidobacteraceae bacterium]
MARARPTQLPEPPFEISLSVRHPSIDPAEISRTLHLEPVEAFRAGDPRPCGLRELESRVHAETFWVGVFGPDSWPMRSAQHYLPDPATLALLAHPRLAGMLEMRLARVCEHLRASHREFLKRLDAEGGRTVLRVTLSPREVASFTLPSAVGRALTELAIAIEFDFSAS